MSATKSSNVCGEVEEIKTTTTYKWTINNFCICHKKISARMKSPIFSMGKNEEFKWRIYLYPKGFDENYKKYVSLFLQLEYCELKEVKTNYRFSIINKKNKKSHEQRSDSNRLFTPGCDWGFREFITRDELFNEKNGLLPNNRLTICCEIDVDKATSDTIGKVSDNKVKVIDDLGLLMENRKYSDLILVASDRKFYVHKAVLAIRSPVFSTMFEADLPEEGQAIIELNEPNQKVIEEVLRYIYTGKVDNLGKMSRSLLQAADLYELEGLKEVCEDAITLTLTVENATEILALADQSNAKKLKNNAMNFIIKNGTDITKTDGFKEMTTTQPHLIAEAFQTMISKLNPGEESSSKKRKVLSDGEKPKPE